MDGKVDVEGDKGILVNVKVGQPRDSFRTRKNHDTDTSMVEEMYLLKVVEKDRYS